jgi:beta-lactamase class A
VAEYVDRAVKEIDARLNELKQEMTRLEAARSALSGARRGPGRPRGSRTTTTRARQSANGRRTRRTRTSTRTRARRTGNTRANQALKLVKDKPGITIPEIAKSMGIEPNYLYRVLPRLANDGQVRKDGAGWHPAK